MVAGKHIIQKQTLEVEMHNPPDAFAFRNRLGQLYYERILPGLEQVFDEIGTAQKLIRKDFLQIDLGIIAPENWEEVFVEKAIRKIKESLISESSLLVSANASRKNTGHNAEYLQKESLANTEEIFYYFLKNGFFPWHVAAAYNLENELLLWIQERPANFKTSFLAFLSEHNRPVILRLIFQFTDVILEKIIAVLLREDFYNEINSYKKQIKKYLQTVCSDVVVLRQLFYYPFFSLLATGRQEEVKLYFHSLIVAVQQQNPSFAYQTIEEQIKLLITQSGHKKNKKLLTEIDQLSSANKSVSDEKEDLRRTFGKTQTAEDNIFIDNAGLVILQPFLSFFFQHLQLCDGNRIFINEASHQRAVLLSQYLVTGDTTISENDIVLNKIICGYPLGQPIINSLELSEMEISEADDLLSQLIQKWTMNNVPVNSSKESLQQSFLQRAGKLQQKENDWLLQVEQKPYDMVLSSLPWSIGIIKNSWMQGMLWVEWT